jgi:uncharacterized repeat protein (TIGR03803 family)
MRPLFLGCIKKLGRRNKPYALILWFVTTAIASHAQTFTSLHSFDFTDGQFPYAGLVQATDGNLYGTVVSGGANGAGTVFKIAPHGTLTTFYSFCSQTGCTDGGEPWGALTQATNGDLYGTTSTDGSVNGGGTIFKVTLAGKLTTLYTFCEQSGCPDGRNPVAGLVLASGGDFYGTTAEGGIYVDDCLSSTAPTCGTFFKIAPDGTFTTHSFNGADGTNPYAGLIQGTNGDFYGTTFAGGAGVNCGGFEEAGCGTVFKITAASNSLTTLHSFNQTNNFYPDAGLVQGSDGNLYGTTTGGGDRSSGTVFKITPSGTLTTIYNFCSRVGCTDGWYPIAGLVQASDGNFYGTTTYGGGGGTTLGCGGEYGCGTVFRITPGGRLTTLHSFAQTDGSFPYAGLVQGTNGDFYGTTTAGGASSACPSGCGTVFRLSLSLAPLVEASPTSSAARASAAAPQNTQPLRRSK